MLDHYGPTTDDECSGEHGLPIGSPDWILGREPGIDGQRHDWIGDIPLSLFTAALRRLMKLSSVCCSILPLGAVPGSKIRSVRPMLAKVTASALQAIQIKGHAQGNRHLIVKGELSYFLPVVLVGSVDEWLGLRSDLKSCLETAGLKEQRMSGKSELAMTVLTQAANLAGHRNGTNGNHLYILPLADVELTPGGDHLDALHKLGLIHVVGHIVGKWRLVEEGHLVAVHNVLAAYLDLLLRRQ